MNNSIPEMVAQRARQHASFDVAAFADQIVRRIAMRDALHVLFDDWTFVEVSRHIMRGGADQLDTSRR